MCAQISELEEHKMFNNDWKQADLVYVFQKTAAFVTTAQFDFSYITLSTSSKAFKLFQKKYYRAADLCPPLKDVAP